MPLSYTKLFSTIIHSTIWRAPDHVRLVWVTMMAMVDKDGNVYASVPGLADAARVSVDQCRDALKVLQSPDPDSRTKDYEGRRVLDIDGGWWLVNHRKYRDMLSDLDKRERNRVRVARHRRRKAECNADVTHVMPSVTNNAGNDIQKQKQRAEAKADVAAEAAAAAAAASDMDPKAAAIAAELRRDALFSRAIHDPDETAEGLLGVAPLAAEASWLVTALKQARAELGSDDNEPTVRRKIRAFVQRARDPESDKQNQAGRQAEAEHEERKRAEARAFSEANERRERERWDRERADPAKTAAAARKALAAITGAIGNGGSPGG